MFPVQMLRQMFLSDRGVGTKLATERLFSRMYANMSVEIALISEHFLTIETWERFRAVLRRRLSNLQRLNRVICRTINAE